MEISLPTGLAEFVAGKVKSGQYESEAEVVRDALRQFQRLGGATAGGVSGFPNLGGLAGSDIEQLAFITLMNATNSANDDLRAIMAQVQAQTAAKQALRALIVQVNRDVSANAGKYQPPLNFSTGMGSEDAYHHAQMPFPDPCSATGVQFVPTDLAPGEITSVAQIQAVQQQLQNQLDSMNDLSTMQSLRMQMAMARWSQVVETLSNVLKKIDDTSDAIVQNLK